MTLRAGIVVLLVALAGCAGSYEAPKLPIEQLATLSSRGNYLDGRLILVSIDGKEIDYGVHVFAAGYKAKVVSLSPSKHTVLLRWRKGAWAIDGEVWFIAEAGREYSAQVRFEEGLVKFWIQDVIARRQTGGMATVKEVP